MYGREICEIPEVEIGCTCTLLRPRPPMQEAGTSAEEKAIRLPFFLITHGQYDGSISHYIHICPGGRFGQHVLSLVLAARGRGGVVPLSGPGHGPEDRAHSTAGREKEMGRGGSAIMQQTVCVGTSLCLRNTQSTQLRGLAMTGSRQDETASLRQKQWAALVLHPEPCARHLLVDENAGPLKLSTIALIGFGTSRATPDGECDT